MQTFQLTTVIQILQISVAPVVLISGVGLIILSQTNRMAHVVSRIRQLNAAEKSASDPRTRQQIELLFKRAQVVRASIAAFLASLFFDALVIIDIFVSKTLGFENGMSVAILFFFSLLSLIVGLWTFLIDVNMSLRAVKIEITP